MDAKTTAFLFPGQGSQTVGMGHALAKSYPIAQETFEEADHVLGFPLSKLSWDGPIETLSDTINTQPALLVHSVAALRVLQDQLPDFRPAFVAGHSLGELSALVAAEALPFGQALKLVRRRGELMKAAGETSPGGMAAILGLDIATVDDICAQISSGPEIVQVANDNCPGQVVISGTTPALERVIASAQDAGAKRVVRLAVSIAAHSPLMSHAQADFNNAVAAAPIRQARIKIIGNVNALPLSSPDEIRADLQAQLNARVRWTESIQYMLEQGVTTFVEVGNGNVLTSLVKRINRKTTRISLGTPEDVEKINSRDESAQATK
ncbi:MAG: ACP S-malonyltransferase [Chloroflexi bacterium]|nr:ACP S-malonyltransferase [Chloroflexota bacterium]